MNADPKEKGKLGIGIFTYKINGDEVITHSYVFDEREGKVIGNEKVMPLELFELEYERALQDYRGINLKTQSKEFIYTSKIKCAREKDKKDVAVIEPELDEKSRKKILRIKLLEAKTKLYRITYDKDGKEESRVRQLSLAEKAYAYFYGVMVKNASKDVRQIVEDMKQSQEYLDVIRNAP